MAHRLRFLLVLLAALAAVLALWYWWQRPLSVETATVTRGTAVEAVYATGVVEPVRWASVAAALKGRLVELDAKEGQQVQKGQLIARLDSTVIAAQVAEAEARARFAEADWERLRRLAGRGAASLSDLDAAESEAHATAAVAEAARRRLDDYVIRAPMDGVVLRRDGEPGEVVDTTQTVYWIGDLHPLRATTEVDEEDIPKVRVSQRALLKADAFPGRPLAGTVDAITPKGDPVMKTFRVRIGLPDDTPLMIGMTVEANIIVEERPDALLVPARAVEDGVVFTVRDGTASRHAVTTGIVGPRFVEIRKGLEEGQTVILEPPAGLTNGRAVRPRPAAPADQAS